MPATVSRKLTLADVMILVAAAAVGLVAWRAFHDYQVATRGPFSSGPLVWRLGLELSPFLMVLTIALLAVRALAPRPALRRILRQPGTVACLVVTGNLLAFNLLMLFQDVLRKLLFRSQVSYGWEAYLSPVLYSGNDVALAWALLAALGAWRPETSWIDRAGRAYGVFLIALWVLLRLSF